MSVVQGFWHGPLGTMEIMCINSYLQAGHEFHLYSYNPADMAMNSKKLPNTFGLFFRQAKFIVPEEKLVLFPWASIFSDFFRYALLNKMGGWWVDMDTICLRPLDDLTSEYVFARDNINQYYITGFMMKAPPSAPIMWDCYNWINDMSQEDRAKLGHMDIGPYLLQRKVPEYGLEKYVVGPEIFDPIPWDKITQVADSSKTIELEEACEKAHVIHLRQSIWNEGPNSCAGILPNGKKLSTSDNYPENALWEILKRKYE